MKITTRRLACFCCHNNKAGDGEHVLAKVRDTARLFHYYSCFIDKAFESIRRCRKKQKSSRNTLSQDAVKFKTIIAMASINLLTILLRSWLLRKCRATWSGSKLNRIRRLLLCNASISPFSSFAWICQRKSSLAVHSICLPWIITASRNITT